jgi:hypothetical protein
MCPLDTERISVQKMNVIDRTGNSIEGRDPTIMF